MNNRQEILQYYRNNPQVDVLIIGGGINGAGTFRDLALQRVRVLLVDAGDFSSGASAASSHMVHGGIRYLENGEFRLVREAVQERERLLKNAPHAVKPLPTTIPMFKWFSGLFNAPLKFLKVLDRPAERGAVVIKLGLLMYDSFTGKDRKTPPHRFHSRAESLVKWPAINPEILCTATYYDAYMPYPERICIELLRDAEAVYDEARALNYVRVVGAAGKTVKLRDEVNGEGWEVAPKVVVNATGPWIDRVNATLGVPTHYMGGTKGSHLVVHHPELRKMIGDHEFFFENKDGRIVLILPFFDEIIIGTSDIAIENPDEARCTDDEIDYFLGMVDRVFPSMQVNRSQIVFTFSGVRPLPSSKAKTTGQITRDHSIEVLPPTAGLEFPVYSLVGGKWTTFRAFSEQTTDVVLKQMGLKRKVTTHDMAIGGGHNYPTDAEGWLADLQTRTRVNPEWLRMWFDRYGSEAAKVADYAASVGNDAPLIHSSEYTRCEIQYLVRQERVEHLDDLALRRTSVGMRGKLTRLLVEELAAIAGEVLGWNQQKQQMEVQRLAEILEDRHRVKLS
ncbi:MAG: glycerol-3-phosphate dehydrogenase/oxidase [Anaerolineales bacterium]